MHPREVKKTADVFGVSNKILPDSYVNRGQLDEEVQRLLARPTHLALRGESKCGKSWLRQKAIEDPLVVQCRLGKTCVDIYRDALSELGIRVELQRTESGSFTGRAEAEAEAGINLIAKIRGKFGVESETGESKTTAPVGQDFTDLKFVADILKFSERKLVIEDFHYLSIPERKKLAFDIKALWDSGVFVVIVGVWSKQNMLLSLNPDLAGRVKEVAVVWTKSDLEKVIDKGSEALNISLSPDVKNIAVDDCFENVGILQGLVLGTLDQANIETSQKEHTNVDDMSAYDSAAMMYAEQLNPLYQQFAQRVSRGIRSRSDSTGIYAHAIAAIMSMPDQALIHGVSIDDIYSIAHGREKRIQKGNLHIVLEKFEQLQVDESGRGLVLGYNESSREMSAVDRQLLLYRKYSTVQWPWEDLIKEAENDESDAYEPER